MDYEIYFDESNKLDSPGKDYSYYGAFGIDSPTVSTIQEEMEYIFSSLHTKSELHFNTYKSNEIKKYFQVLNHFLQKEIHINLYIIDNKRFLAAGEKLLLDVEELRKYFYVKIPERLFYGIVRHVDNVERLIIYMDDNTEYQTLDVYNKVKDQMNAHSLYRNKGYIVKEVKGLSSADNKMVQVIDSFMGIIVFILQKDYLQSSKIKRGKADLIYRLLMEEGNVARFQSMINLFLWSGESDKIDIVYLSSKITEFLVYMNIIDSQEMQKIHEIYATTNCKELPFKEKVALIKKETDCSNAEIQIFLGYAMQIEHGDRNKFVR